MGVLLFFCELDTVLLLMPFKIALLLALWAPMNLVVSDSTQLCFMRMVARAGLLDSRKAVLAQLALCLALNARLSGSFES